MFDPGINLNTILGAPFPPVINIRSRGGEYRVPGPDRLEAQAYYTPDRADAIDTARLAYGPLAIIKVNGRVVSALPCSQ